MAVCTVRVCSPAPGKRGSMRSNGVVYLVLSDYAVRVRRLPPLQHDLLLIGAALDGLQRDGSRHCSGKRTRDVMRRVCSEIDKIAVRRQQAVLQAVGERRLSLPALLRFCGEYFKWSELCN